MVTFGSLAQIFWQAFEREKIVDLADFLFRYRSTVGADAKRCMILLSSLAVHLLRHQTERGHGGHEQDEVVELIASASAMT